MLSTINPMRIFKKKYVIIKTNIAIYRAEIIPFKFNIDLPITPQLSNVKI